MPGVCIINTSPPWNSVLQTFSLISKTWGRWEMCNLRNFPGLYPGIKGQESENCREEQMWRTPVCVCTPDAHPEPGSDRRYLSSCASFSFLTPCEGREVTLCKLDRSFDLFLAWACLGREGFGLFNDCLAAEGNDEEGLLWVEWELQKKLERTSWWSQGTEGPSGFLNSSSNRSLRVAWSSPTRRLGQWLKSLCPAGLMMTNQIYLYKIIMTNDKKNYCDQNYLLHSIKVKTIIMV